MIAMMRMIPGLIRKKITAPMISKEFKNSAKKHATGIELNLDNLLTCSDYCGGCLSKPQVPGEALYCSSGKSAAVVEMKGCNCMDCPLFEQCGSDSIGYFCKYGVSLFDKAKENIAQNNSNTFHSDSVLSQDPESNSLEQSVKNDELRYLKRFTKKLLKGD